MKRWRSHGLRAIVYIDDGICVASTEAESKAVCDFIVEDLHRARSVLNLEKSALEPTQIGRWLGFTIDLDSGAFLVREEKISKLRSSVTSMVAAGSCSARQLASVVGQIISMSLAIGPVARLYTRSMYDFINTSYTWNERRCLPNKAREELLFWQGQVGAVMDNQFGFPRGRQE